MVISVLLLIGKWSVQTNNSLIPLDPASSSRKENKHTGMIKQAVDNCILSLPIPTYMGRRGRDHMVVGYTTTYAISAHHH